MSEVRSGAPATNGGPSISGPYSWYALFVLVIVYALSFMDRQILSILAEDIKEDLSLTDAELGFLYGTVFSIFYTVFGIPLGRLADNWRRGKLLALGLTLWSGMTMLSGFASSFAQLALARIGVGVGEASAGPAAFSMIAGYFSKERRALAISIYATGAYIGLGLSLPIGGWIADAWNNAYAAGGAPLDLAGWQAAFIIVGFPGIIVALWVLSLREPARPSALSSGSNVWVQFFLDVCSVLPPLTLWSVSRYKGELVRNVVAALLIGASVGALAWWTGDYSQWIAVGVGVYSIFSWTQALRHTDRPAYHLIWGSWSVPLGIIGFGGIAVMMYSAGFWAAPYAMRTFEISAASAGALIGIPGAIASAIGVIAAGRLSDYWKKRDARGRIFTCMIGAIAPAPLILLMYTRNDLESYLLISPLVYMFTAMFGGSAVAVYQDLVLPRMYGTIGAIHLVGTTMVGLALGPYGTGKIATLTGSLQIGVFSMLLVAPIATAALWLMSRSAPRAEATKFDRATASGERSLDR